MPSQAYAFEEGGPKRLEIAWTGLWKKITIQLDGATIGTVSGQRQLSAGQEFLLPDGSTLRLQLVRALAAVELRVLRDGQPLPGTASAPETRLRVAYGAMFWIAGLSIVLGLVASVFQIEFLQSMGLGLTSAVLGAGFLVLGFFVRRGSLMALIVAIAVLALDGILALVTSASTEYVIARFIGLVPLVQGIGAVRAIRGREDQADRKATLGVAIVTASLLLCVGMGSAGILIGRLAMNSLIERAVITDPSEVANAARSMAEYDLPPGYREEMVMDFFLFKALMIARTDSSSEGSRGPIFSLMQTSSGRVDEDEFSEQVRAAMEQQWQTADFAVEQAATEKVTICGQEVTLLIYEGIDEEGNASRQVTSSWFEVKGKPTGLMVMGFTEDWDQAQVDGFIQSIR